MRLAQENNNQNSTVICTLNSLQQNSLPKSNLSEILEASSILKSLSSPDRPNNQETTEEERINNPLKSINIPLLDTTACNIHISSDFTKELYLKHIEKMKNNNSLLLLDDVSNLVQTKMLNISELKDMILLLTKNFNNKMRREYDEDMTMNRSNLNIYMKLFKRQHRFLVKYISKLNKILPESVLSVKPKGKANKNVTPASKRENVNLIAQEQTQEDHKLSIDNTNYVLDLSKNRNSVCDDDDCEPKLVIDERSLEPSDNVDFNKSEFNTISVNKNIGETLNKRKDKKKAKHSSKKAKQKTKQSNEISQEEKSTLNEYQEWQRQKTMAKKYFTIPLTDTNKVIAEDKTVLQLNDKKESNKKKMKKKLKKCKKISEEKPILNEYQEWQRQKTMALKYFTIPMTDTSKVKTAPQLTKTQTTKQSNGCQTLIPIKRKNTEDLKTTSSTDIAKRLKLPSNENEVVCISDESDDDVQITECNIKKTSSKRYKSNIPQLKRQHAAADQSVCVINTTVTTISQPLFLIINGVQMPVATQGDVSAQNTEAINNPLHLQVLPNSTPFPTQTQTLVPEANNCREASNCKCKCVKCQENWRDKNLSCTMRTITDVAFRENRPIKKAITVEEYLSDNKKLTTLIKVDGTQNVVFFCNKYIILTDVDISSDDATYRTTSKTKNYKSLLQVLVPNDSKSGVLHLGLKSASDFIHCKCVRGALVKCNLCHYIENNLPKATNFLKIDRDYYKKMSDNPIKYVRLTKIELETNSPMVLEGNPNRIFVSNMHFKKLTDSPPTYIRILCSVPDSTMLRLLVHNQVLLYAFDVTQTQHYHTPLMYSLTAGQVTVDHSDTRLVRVLQWILN